MENSQTIDLSTCTAGDFLISSHGTILEYVGKTPMHGLTYLDHVVRYRVDKDGKFSFPNNSLGTRTNDGFVFRSNRIPESDEDIILIIPKSKFVQHKRGELIPMTKIKFSSVKNKLCK
jgi:hypothetical protein